MRILGIDPGYERLGLSVIETNPKETLLYSDSIRTPADIPFSNRLLLLGKALETVISTYKPVEMAYEQLYFTNNQKTAMFVAEVRGAISYICSKAGVAINEYTPGQIKVAVCGDGRADKKQVAFMVERLVKMPPKKQSEKRLDDEYDAIAAALTHAACRNSRTSH